MRLHVLEWGRPDGWPVVILHGGSQSAACWQEVCEGLPEQLRCIVPDQRGHGESDQAADGDYSCAAQVADLEGLLEVLAVPRCALVGHSMGGLNALRFAGTRPERVTALVLVDVGSETRKTGLARTRQRVRPMPQRMSFEKARRWMATRYPARDAAWIERQLRRELREVEPDCWEAKTDMRFRHFVSTYGGDVAERRRLLATSRAPLLVIRGQHSRILTPESAALTARLGGGHVVDIPDSGHGIPLDNPSGAAAALARFLVPLVRPAS